VTVLQYLVTSLLVKIYLRSHCVTLLDPLLLTDAPLVVDSEQVGKEVLCNKLLQLVKRKVNESRVGVGEFGGLGNFIVATILSLYHLHHKVLIHETTYERTEVSVVGARLLGVTLEAWEPFIHISY
jgi:hypothetical protein